MAVDRTRGYHEGTDRMIMPAEKAQAKLVDARHDLRVILTKMLGDNAGEEILFAIDALCEAHANVAALDHESEHHGYTD